MGGGGQYTFRESPVLVLPSPSRLHILESTADPHHDLSTSPLEELGKTDAHSLNHDKLDIISCLH